MAVALNDCTVWGRGAVPWKRTPPLNTEIRSESHARSLGQPKQTVSRIPSVFAFVSATVNRVHKHAPSAGGYLSPSTRTLCVLSHRATQTGTELNLRPADNMLYRDRSEASCFTSSGRGNTRRHPRFTPKSQLITIT